MFHSFYQCLFLPFILFINLDLSFTFKVSHMKSNFTCNENQIFVNWLSKLKFVLTSDPLIEDINFDGAIDLVFSTVDGVLYCINDVFMCMRSSTCRLKWGNWPVFLHGEHFLSSPVSIDLNGNGVKLITFISHGARIFIFDFYGNLDKLFNVFNLFVPYTDMLSPFNYWINKLGWERSPSNKSNIYFHPHVYTDSLVQTFLSDLDQSSDWYTDNRFLILNLNFISDDFNSTLSNSSRLILSTLMFISRCALGMEGILLSGCEPGLKILDYGLLNSTYPSFLFSPSTLVISDAQPYLNEDKNDSKFVVNYLITPTYSGSIYVVDLQFTSKFSIEVFRPGPAFKMSPVTHLCLPTRCPKSSLPFRNSTACCLILDTRSCLFLVLISLSDYQNQHRSFSRTLWTYCPSNFVENDQTTKVLLVPQCSNNSNCLGWAIYTTLDGFVHVVSVETGQAIDGYPLDLFSSDLSKRSHLVPGLGILFVDPIDFKYFVVFTTVRGLLIYLKLEEFSITYFSVFDFDKKNKNSIVSVSSVLNLKPNTPDLFFITDRGLLHLSLFPSIETCEHDLARLKSYQLMNVKFLSENEEIDQIVWDEGFGLIKFALEDCSFGNFITNHQYLIKLSTSFGFSLINWTLISLFSANSTLLPNCPFRCVCSMHQLESDLEMVGFVRGYLYVHLLNKPVDSKLAMNYHRFEISFDAGSTLTKSIIGLVYLPSIYLCISLLTMHILSSSILTIFSSCIKHKGGYYACARSDALKQIHSA